MKNILFLALLLVGFLSPIFTQTNIDCANAVSFTCDVQIEVDFDGVAINMDAPVCVNGPFDVPALWYSFMGNGDIVSIQINTNDFFVFGNIYTGDCTNLECAMPEFFDPFVFEPIVILTEPNVEYYLLIYPEFDIPEEPVTVDISCAEPASNDECSGAISLECFQATVQGDWSLATFDEVPDCGYGPFSEVGLWYSFTGTGEIATVNVLPESGDFAIINVYLNDCDNLICFDNPSYDPIGSGGYTFFAELDQDYLIMVCPENQGVSFQDVFEISIGCFMPEINDECSGAIEVNCGVSLTVGLGNATFNSNEIQCAEGPFNQSTVWYSIEGTGDILAITSSSQSGSIGLLSVYQGDCNNLECIFNPNYQPFFANSTFFLNSEIGETYYIAVFSDAVDDAVLFEIECFAPLPNDNCSGASPIDCEETIFFDLVGSTGEADNVPFCDFGPIGGGLWYSIAGNDNLVTLLFNQSVATGNVFISLYTGSCDGNLECEIIEGYDPFTLNPISFFAEMNTTYYMLIDYDPFDVIPAGEFTVLCDLEYVEPCTVADPLVCGSTATAQWDEAPFSLSAPNCNFGFSQNGFWYFIEGTGDLFDLNLISSDGGTNIIDVYLGSCDNLICVENFGYDPFISNSYLLNTIVGETYYIRISPEFIIEDESFELTVNCVDPAVNDQCEDAMAIECGAELSVNLIGASFDEGVDCGFGPFEQPGVWYTITGNDQIISISATTAMGNMVGISVYTNSCGVLECFENFAFDPYLGLPYTFQSSQNEEYYILIWQDQFITNEVIDLSITCNEPVSNNECENAIGITCGQNIVGSTAASTSDQNVVECTGFFDISGVWYTFEADAMTTEISFTDINQQTVVTLFGDDCSVDGCLDFRDVFGNQSIEFTTSIGSLYHINISAFEPDELEFSFTVNTCAAAPNAGGGVDNQAEEIPTMGEWALCSLLLLLMIIGVVGLKQNKPIELLVDE